MNKTGQPNKPAKYGKYCKICQDFIKGGSHHYNAHLFKHNAVKARFHCEFCLKNFYRKDTYRAHVDRHNKGYRADVDRHNKGNRADVDRHNKGIRRKSYICDYCGRSFVLKNNLIVHLKRIHDDNLDSELGKFKCSICNVYYCERRLLYVHIRRIHFNIKETKEPLHRSKSVNETWVENVNRKNATVSITKVNNNVIIIKQLKIDCKVEETKPNAVDSKTECMDQYSKGICNYCNKEMLKKSLRNHIKEVHMDIRKFKCKVCKETFARHYQMVEHKCGHFKRKKRNNVIINKL